MIGDRSQRVVIVTRSVLQGCAERTDVLASLDTTNEDETALGTHASQEPLNVLAMMKRRISVILSKGLNMVHKSYAVSIVDDGRDSACRVSERHGF